MKIISTKIKDIFLIESLKHTDLRGSFMETYRKDIFSDFGIHADFVQDNYVKSGKNILRGLHYQKNNPQGKLIRCVRGEIFDVAVDLRKTSASYGEWIGFVLSESNNLQLYIPPGMAHGYCVRSNSAEVFYKCTQFYKPDDEHGIIWNDKDISIDWGIDKPIVSEKDMKWPIFNN